MSGTLVECLRCGRQHELVHHQLRHVQEGECPRCGYLGWAEVEALDERLRRRLRDVPVERRILIAV